MYRAQNSKRRTISSAKSRPWWPDSNKSVSGKPGAVQSRPGDDNLFPSGQLTQQPRQMSLRFMDGDLMHDLIN